jgi:enoyl-CoA hydratase
MSGQQDILFERRGAVGLITLNRPRVLNALTLDMFKATQVQLDAWATDPAVHAVIIEGAGEKAFCAGGDIRALYEAGRAGDPLTAELFRVEYRLNRFIKFYPKPYIALMDGIAMGGGVGVSIHGSHRVATERSMFAMPETGIGLIPDVGGGYFLPRLPGRLGMFLGLTGTRALAADMVYTGLATHYVPADRLADLIAALTDADWRKMGPKTVDRAVADRAGVPEPAALARHRAAIDRCFAGNSVEDVLAALDAEGTDWAQAVLDDLGKKSPTSLKLTFRQLTQGARMSFDEVMVMEYRLSQACMAGHDFFEGVRALIIDKDGIPRWSPDRLEAVSGEVIARAFAPLGERDLTFD